MPATFRFGEGGEGTFYGAEAGEKGELTLYNESYAKRVAAVYVLRGCKVTATEVRGGGGPTEPAKKFVISVDCPRRMTRKERAAVFVLASEP